MRSGVRTFALLTRRFYTDEKLIDFDSDPFFAKFWKLNLYHFSTPRCIFLANLYRQHGEHPHTGLVP